MSHLFISEHNKRFWIMDNLFNLPLTLIHNHHANHSCFSDNSVSIYDDTKGVTAYEYDDHNGEGNNQSFSDSRLSSNSLAYSDNSSFDSPNKNARSLYQITSSHDK